jgi:hypothetical protein
MMRTGDMRIEALVGREGRGEGIGDGGLRGGRSLLPLEHVVEVERVGSTCCWSLPLEIEEEGEEEGGTELVPDAAT